MWSSQLEFAERLNNAMSPSYVDILPWPFFSSSVHFPYFCDVSKHLFQPDVLTPLFVGDGAPKKARAVKEIVFFNRER